MQFIDPLNNTNLENYKLLIGSVIPRPIAFITTISKEGVVNGAPFSYFNIVSSTPPLLSIAIRRENGKIKDTLRNILENKEFVIHIVDSTNVEAINKTAINFPYNNSEIEYADLTLIESIKVKVPGVKEAKIRLECKLEDRFEIKDKETIVTDLVIGKVVGYNIDEDILFEGKINTQKLDPVARLAGNSYSKLGEIFELKKYKL
jgi:flavin reductase (DIM6/NTAB) family NADH-FMN oxidoreductase RutF